MTNCGFDSAPNHSDKPLKGVTMVTGRWHSQCNPRCVRVCHNEKKVPDEWQAWQAIRAMLQVSSKRNAKKITRVRRLFHQSITAILCVRARGVPTRHPEEQVAVGQAQFWGASCQWTDEWWTIVKMQASHTNARILVHTVIKYTTANPEKLILVNETKPQPEFLWLCTRVKAKNWEAVKQIRIDTLPVKKLKKKKKNFTWAWKLSGKTKTLLLHWLNLKAITCTCEELNLLVVTK